MIWKDSLKNSVSELTEHLKKDVQCAHLSKNNIRQIAGREIEIFIQKAKKWTPEELILKENTDISKIDQAKINQLIKKRSRNIPLAHIIGQHEFYGLSFKLDKNTLIPRPETEELVEQVLNFISKQFSRRNRPFILVDIGTGSGCILVSIMKHLNTPLTKYKAFGIDQSRKALEVAKLNVKALLGDSAKIKLIRTNKLNFLNKIAASDSTTLLIVANLPYLSEKEYVNLSREVKKEPYAALVGGRQGHEIIVEYLNQLSKLAYKKEIFLEISPTIAPKLKKYCASNKKISRYKFSRDLNKKIRFLQVGM